MIPIVRTYSRNPIYLNNLLNDVNCGGRMETFAQKVNIIENENDFNLDIIVPGYERSEIKVTIDNNELKIASIKNEEEEIDKKNYLRKEFLKKPFNRSFELPKGIEADKIEASHKNGILRIMIPKKAKVEIPVKEIDVK
jgi:HSP20 family protein